MKLLILTQAVDTQNQALGFFTEWIKEFSKHTEKLTVVCLTKGTYDVPQNVTILSLGKENHVSRLGYIINFYKYIWQKRKEYDAVFVHMNAEYIILGAPVWTLLGKKFSLWYNHTYGTWKARLAFRLANPIFHTSPFAYSAYTKKSVRMPAGINMNIFKKDHSVSPRPGTVMYVGRLSRVKKVHILIEAVKYITTEHVPVHLDIVGSPDSQDIDYNRELNSLARDLIERGIVTFLGSVPNTETPALYSAHIGCVNLTPRGNYDKTVLEAMACESISLVSSEAFKDLIPPEFFFKEDDARDLARALHMIFALRDEERRKIGEDMRQRVQERHALTVLVPKIIHMLS